MAYDIKEFQTNELNQVVRSTEREVFDELLNRACVVFDKVRITNDNPTQENYELEVDAILRCISAH